MNNVSAVLFGLAFFAPPLAVLLGVLLLAIPSRARHAVGTHAVAHR